MAEYIPGSSVTRSAAISALRHAPAPDDNDVESRNSIMNVDYLSHEWQEEADVWASWRHTTRHKNDIANGVRLENASWRTWWKQRNHLSTISPETLNWLKDSDVTWLYGPLHTAADPVPPPKVATAEDRLDLVKAVGKKPILKHRSISELLSIPRGSSPSIESGHLETIPENGDDRPALTHTKSESFITRTGIRRVSPPLPDLAHAPDLILGEDSSESPRVASDAESMASGHIPKRHISFNTFVEQCIAIDHPRPAMGNLSPPWRVGFSSPAQGSDAEEDDDDDGTVLTMRSTSSSGQSSPASSRRPSSSNSRSNSHSSERMTIQAIAPTLLKTQFDDDADPGESPAIVFVPPLGSPYSEDLSVIGGPSSGCSPELDDLISSSGFVGRVGGPSHPSRWEDQDRDRGVGLDYFQEPNRNTSREGQSASSTSPPRRTGPAKGPLPSRAPQSPPKATKAPGRSILKPSIPEPAITDPLLDNIDRSDTYFSQNPNSIPSPPVAVPSSSLDDKISSILGTTSDIGITLDPTSTLQSRGRSAVRIPGSAIGIADRERSASSKGSSPIGSVSPNSRAIAGGAASRAAPSRTLVARKNSGRMVGVRLPSPSSKSTVSSNSSDSSSPHSEAPPGGVREDGFHVKSSPVKPSRKKRASVDGAPVLPTQSQLAPAQLSPGLYPPSSETSPQFSIEPVSTAVNPNGPSPHTPVKVYDSEDEGAPDGTDGYFYHSNHPTPVSSPTNHIKPLLPPVDVAATHTSPPTRGRGGVPTVSIGLDRVSSPGAYVGSHAPDETNNAREDGTLVSRAVEIVSSARGIMSAFWNAGAGQPGDGIPPGRSS